MVSFSCEACGDVFTKKKLDPHRNRCRGATFTCIDCMVYFPGTEYRAHTSCISEAEKYQGSLYKNKKARTVAPSNDKDDKAAMARHAYVEEVADDDYRNYAAYEDHAAYDTKSTIEPLPEAPTPPTHQIEEVNVFDYLVASNTPTASNLSAAHGHRHIADDGETTQLVPYDYDENVYVDANGYMVDDGELVQYGRGPVPSASFQTPAPKVSRRKTRGSEAKTDKKRKRLHIETGDQVMTDAPPVLHSGLTGGISRLMKPTLPPSPDYSGGDAGPSPASPLKKTKHGKSKGHHDGIGNNLLAMITTGTKKSKKRKVAGKRHGEHGHRHRHRLEEGDKPKLLEYRPQSSDEKQAAEGGQMILYRPRAEAFLGFVNKGPDSQRGCSMNKALKRYHRERSDSGSTMSKHMEEKELWKSLRLRLNDRGEVVVFSL